MRQVAATNQLFTAALGAKDRNSDSPSFAPAVENLKPLKTLIRQMEAYSGNSSSFPESGREALWK